MIKQHSWNDKTRNGSFKENFNNPKAKLFIKLSPTEVAEIMNSAERRCECSGYHSSPNQIVKFSFKPGFTSDNEFRGLSFSAMRESKEDSTDKTQILVGFNAGDLVMIREFLSKCLSKHFDNLIKENLEKLTNEDFNEYLVQSKLEPELFKKFYKYLQKNKLNRSSGIKKILNIFL